MADEKKNANDTPLPLFLISCIAEGIIDEKTAYRIETVREESIASTFGMLEAIPDPSLRFSSFYPCRANAMAIQIAKKIAEERTAPAEYNPIYFYGDTGLGKTHLLSAIANELGDREVLFLNAAYLDNECIEAIAPHENTSFRNWLRSFYALVIDDIQQCPRQKEIENAVAFSIDEMAFLNRPVVVGSDRPLEELSELSDFLLSRLSRGVKAKLEIGDEAERFAIVKGMVGENTVPNTVLHYIAAQIDDSVRRLKSTVTQLIAIHNELARPITVNLAQTVIYGEPDRQHRTIASLHPGMSSEIDLDSSKPSLESDVAELFKKMLVDAETEEEQALALQIAISERVRQLKRDKNAEKEALENLEHALEMLREGSLEEAIHYINRAREKKDEPFI
ncbi:MAG: ATP-binding protein [Deltaproteobacteria bacterium]|nr:ATP-binding protein [Deltaproteobacteria bacterium]